MSLSTGDVTCLEVPGWKSGRCEVVPELARYRLSSAEEMEGVDRSLKTVHEGDGYVVYMNEERSSNQR